MGFPAARTVHTGDMFQRKALPFVDVDNSGGSAVEFGETLTKAVAGIRNVDIVIPGHVNALVTWTDFTNFAGFYKDLVRVAREGMEARRSVDEAARGYSVPDRYREFDANPDTVKAIMQHIYNGR